MRRPILQSLAWVMVVEAACFWCLPTAAGAEPAAAPPAKTVSEAKETSPPKEPAAPDGGSAEASRVLREQTIYIPYEKFRRVFEKEGRGVFLPYERFRQLWEAAAKKVEPPPPAKPPAGQVITEAEYEAVAAKEVVRVRATLKIDLLQEGWNEVPLRLGDVAITSATIGGKPARIVSAGPAGHKLLVERTGKTAESVVLVLEFAKAIARSPGQNSVSFEVPQAAVSRWRVRIPEAGVKVNLQPAIAVTEVSPDAEAGTKAGADAAPPSGSGSGGEKPQAPGASPTKPATTKPATAPNPAGVPAKPESGAARPAEETVVQAFVGATPNVRIEWTPKAEGAAGLEALATVEVQQEVSVTEGAVRHRVQLAYTISRAELRQLALELPADQRVINVVDANVRQWRVEPAGAVQRVVVELFEPARQSQNLLLELEQYAGGPPPGVKPGEAPKPAKGGEAASALTIPVVRASGVSRQQGLVVVAAADGLRIEPVHSSGVMQVDTAELPAALAPRRWAYAFRYAAVPFEVRLAVAKVQPRLVADCLVEAELQPERVNLDVLALVDVQRAGVFRLEMELPAGYRVDSVAGRAAAGAAAAPYEAHHLEGAEKRVLVVNLSKKALGRVGLHVALSRELKEPDLLAPTGKTAQVPVGIPRVLPGPEGRATGRIVVLAPGSLQVNPATVEGLRRISHREALEGMESPRPARGSDARPVLEFAYADEPAMLVVAAERRKPFLVVRQFLSAQIEDAAVQYEATFFFQVQYSGVKSLRIDVPKAVAELIKVPTPEIRYQAIEPPPADVAPDYVAWRIAGGKELLGDGQFQFRWTQKMPKLEVGRGVPITVPHLRPREVDLAWGQIVLKKAETIDIDEASGKLTNLRPIDPQHDLMPGASAPDAARAYAFYDDFVLTVNAVRYELKDIKPTSIERALLRMVITRADRIAVQALYQVRSAQQRLAIVLPEGAEVDRRPRINGQSVVLEQGGGNQYFLPLAGHGPEDLLLLEIHYVIPGNSRLEYPVFPEDPAVQRVYLAVYVPEEWVLVGRRGPWTDEFTWRGDGLRFRPVCHRDENALLEWVAQGTGQQPINLFFPTDGQMYLFSTLRPAEPAVGALRLVTFRSEGLHAVVMGVLGLAGVALVPAGARRRTTAVALVAIALLIFGVFAPILARQVMFGVSVSAAGVAIVWTTAWIWSRRGAAGAVRGGAPPLAAPPNAAGTASAGSSQPASEADRPQATPSAGAEPQPSEAPAQPQQKGGAGDA